jgi:hypothetical protein
MRAAAGNCGDNLGAGLLSSTSGETVFDSISSYIAILNLIANLSFFIINPKKNAVTRID